MSIFSDSFLNQVSSELKCTPEALSKAINSYFTLITKDQNMEEKEIEKSQRIENKVGNQKSAITTKKKS